MVRERKKTKGREHECQTEIKKKKDEARNFNSTQ